MMQIQHPSSHTTAPPPDTPTHVLAEIAAHKIRTQFKAFVIAGFRELDPSTELHWNWHLDLLCYTLSRTLPPASRLNPTPHQPLRRVIINVPPRSLKSIMASVLLPAFILGHCPHERIIRASYSGRLSQKFNTDMLKIIRSPWYASIFPHTVLAKETEAKVTTTRSGHAISTSVGGTVTGEGGNYLIADDLLNPLEAASDVERNNANQWFSGSFFPSRLNDKKNGVCIIIMQRLHEEDLTGLLLAKNETLPAADRWHHLNLPARNDDDDEIYFYDDTFHIYAHGEVLQPHRETHDMLKAYEVDMGSYDFANQYLQKPAPLEGNLISLKNFPRYNPQTLPVTFTQIVQSWDTAIKATSRSDYSVCTTWGITATHYYLLDLFLDKLEYPQLLPATKQLAGRFNPHAILIEDKGSGQQLLQDLRSQTTLPVIPIMPEKDKVLRMAAISPILQQNICMIPELAEKSSWWPQFANQIMFFPNARHDDIPDSISQFLNWMRKNNVNRFRIRTV